MVHDRHHYDLFVEASYTDYISTWFGVAQQVGMTPGLRPLTLVTGTEDPVPDYYDTETQLNEYLVFHYGEGRPGFGVGFWPGESARISQETCGVD